jgi:ABC-type multidrug transport system ATPase subunit
MIQVSTLWKKFGKHEALRGLSFAVPPGSAFALIGANGAGKTTTIKILMILSRRRGAAFRCWEWIRESSRRANYAESDMSPKTRICRRG